MFKAYIHIFRLYIYKYFNKHNPLFKKFLKDEYSILRHTKNTP